MNTWKSLQRHGVGVGICVIFFAVILAVIETQKISHDAPKDRPPVSEARSETHTAEDNRHRPTETDKVGPPEASDVARPPDAAPLRKSSFREETAAVSEVSPQPPENPEGMPRIETPPGSPPSAQQTAAPLSTRRDTAGSAAAHQRDAPVPGVVSDPVLQSFQQTDFYRTLLEYNLFAPLGTAGTREAPTDYQLLATLIPGDTTDTENRPEAVLRRTADNTTRNYHLGDRITPDTVLIEIHPKYITLETNGQRRTLPLDMTNIWLK